MATKIVSADPTVQQHYLAQMAITAGLWSQLRMTWMATSPLAGNAEMKQYGDAVATVVTQFSRASVASSMDFFATMRTQADVIGRAAQTPVPTPPDSLIQADLEWAFRARQQVEADAASIQARVEAAMQKAVADTGREQVIASVSGDENALGFARIARPGACAFCLSQSIRRKRDGRVGVYKTRGTAGAQANQNFTGSGEAKFHNNCHCLIVPIFDAAYELEPALQKAEQLYVASTLNSGRGEALNDFRRALANTRPADKPNAALVPINGRTAVADIFRQLVEDGATPSAA